MRAPTINDPLYAAVKQSIAMRTKADITPPDAACPMPSIIGFRLRVGTTLRLNLVWWTKESARVAATSKGSIPEALKCAVITSHVVTIANLRTAASKDAKASKHPPPFEALAKALNRIFAREHFGHATVRGERNLWWWRPSFDPKAHGIALPALEGRRR